MVGLCEGGRLPARPAARLLRRKRPSPAATATTACAPPAQWDGTQAAQKLLSCIYRVGQASGVSFGAQHLIDVLRGKSTPRVRDYGHERLSTFGIGADLTDLQWRAVVRQLVMHRLIQVDHDQFNVLKLLPASREVLKGERQLILRHSAPPAPRRGRQRGSAGAIPGPGKGSVIVDWCSPGAVRSAARMAAHDGARAQCAGLHRVP